jgi:hypothetical protein
MSRIESSSIRSSAAISVESQPSIDDGPKSRM